MIKKGKGKKSGIKYCVVREDPTQRWKKTMPKNLAAKIPAQTPAFNPQDPKSMPKRMTQPKTAATGKK